MSHYSSKIFIGEVVHALGGTSNHVAKICNIHKSYVRKWKWRGYIPRKYWEILSDESGIPLSRFVEIHLLSKKEDLLSKYK